MTAKDGAADPRIATATVLVEVQDVEDELPIFQKLQYEAKVPENIAEYQVIDVMVRDKTI